MGDMPGKTHCMRDTRRLGQFLEALPVITVADDEVCRHQGYAPEPSAGR